MTCRMARYRQSPSAPTSCRSFRLSRQRRPACSTCSGDARSIVAHAFLTALPSSLTPAKTFPHQDSTNEGPFALARQCARLGSVCGAYYRANSGAISKPQGAVPQSIAGAAFQPSGAARQTPVALGGAVDSRAEVDQLVKKAVTSGGKHASDPMDHGFSTAGTSSTLRGPLGSLLDGSGPRPEDLRRFRPQRPCTFTGDGRLMKVPSPSSPS